MIYEVCLNSKISYSLICDSFEYSRFSIPRVQTLGKLKHTANETQNLTGKRSDRSDPRLPSTW